MNALTRTPTLPLSQTILLPDGPLELDQTAPGLDIFRGAMTSASQNENEGTNSAPLRRALNGDVIEVLASGSWTALHAAELSETIEESPIDAPPRRKTNIDLAGVRELDTFGARLIFITRQIHEALRISARWLGALEL